MLPLLGLFGVLRRFDGSRVRDGLALRVGRRVPPDDLARRSGCPRSMFAITPRVQSSPTWRASAATYSCLKPRESRRPLRRAPMYPASVCASAIDCECSAVDHALDME